MYTSPDEARSDLFLAGAVYLFAPTILSILLGILRLDRVRVVALVLAFVLPVATTVVVPWLLIRYRRESLRDYGLGIGGAGVGPGVLAALPLVAVGVLVAVAGGASPLAPFAIAGGDSTLAAVQRLLHWGGLTALAVYCTVKARDAFRGDPRPVRTGVFEVGRWVAIAAGATTLLLFLALPPQLTTVVNLVLLPLGAAGTVALALRMVQGPTAVTRAVLLTPAILLALRPFVLFGPALQMVQGLWQATVLAGIGLAIAVLLEGRRSAMPAIGLALAVALATSV